MLNENEKYEWRELAEICRNLFPDQPPIELWHIAGNDEDQSADTLILKRYFKLKGKHQTGSVEIVLGPLPRVMPVC